MSEDLGELERTRVLCRENVRNPMESVHNLLVVNCSVGQGGKNCKRFGIFTVRGKPSRRLGESEDVLKEVVSKIRTLLFSPTYHAEDHDQNEHNLERNRESP